MKSTIDFLKRNWLLIAVVILFLWVWKSKVTDFRGYKTEIRLLSDSIAKKDSEYRLMGDRLSVSSELIQAAIYERDAYCDTLEKLRKRNKTIIIRYETEINNLKRVPTDSIYIDVSGWLNSLSFQ